MSIPIRQSSPIHKSLQSDSSPPAALSQSSSVQTSGTQPIAQPGNASGIYLSALIVALPIFVGLGMIVHKKRRAALLRQRIETLERIWRLNYRKTTS